MSSRSGLDVPILADLAAAGAEVPDLVALRKTGGRYPWAVIDVLVDWLNPTVDDPSLQEKLVRALSVPGARQQALPVLLELFGTAPGGSPAAESRRWAVGNALDVLATDAVFEQMANFAADRGFGASRQMIVSWLGKTKKNRGRATDILLGLLDDSTVDGHAVEALAKLKDPTTVEALRPFANDPRRWVRTKAERTVAELGH